MQIEQVQNKNGNINVLQGEIIKKQQEYTNSTLMWLQIRMSIYIDHHGRCETYFI